MIDAVDQRLQDWVGKLVRPAEVVLCHPGEMQGKEGVSLHLLELISSPPLRGVNRGPLCLSLRYLLTTWFAELKTGHRLLGQIAFAAMREKDMELEPGSFPMDQWRQFGVAPRPSLLLQARLTKPQPEEELPRVRGKMAVRFGGMRPLQGRVLGPGRIPIMAASVTVASLQITTRTDYDGRFRFAAVPQDPPVTLLQVNARGREISWPIPPGAGHEPLLIELNNDQL